MQFLPVVLQVAVQTAEGVAEPPLVASNSTVQASAPSVLLSNLTAGVPYVVSVAASTHVGWGPWSAPQRLRVQPKGHSHRCVRYPFSCCLFLF